ncbi:acetoacetate decarboxylase [Spongiactinospora gelatinilytica]|uniref:Acetoacetate decarboxylase n=1 Tax=Spongiactinospora gelatinilytica TaxID=2666298 RepID=A0A2W2GGL3_9ACTN|nr:acetoacetate decarboxylase family protein [Spongiactinospora gelatinilytica]PZG36168.1 acetoacetate decarboxylase [Spongiactinospora gelatinilytica]
MAHHLIQGRLVTMPVRVREATACVATYLVRADAARAVIAYSGLDITEVVPGRAACTLTFIQYTDSDLGSYGEFGVSFLVRPPGAARVRGSGGALAGLSDVRRVGTGAFVHWLPVDQAFTMEAGRGIWGFPKELADIDLRLDSPYKRCVLRRDGRLVLDLLVKPGMPVPVRRTAAPFDAYTDLGGVIRRTPWSMSPRGVRARPGGALIRLGNHPIAKELSELGLPKHALMTATVTRMSMTIGEAVQA